MHPQVSIRKATPSSSEIDSVSHSDADHSARDVESAEDHYSEGRTELSTSESDTEAAVAPVCPAPVRMVVGMFSALTGLTGMAMLIYGGMGLNRADDPETAQHQALVIAGGIMTALGFFGTLPACVNREPPAP